MWLLKVCWFSMKIRSYWTYLKNSQTKISRKLEFLLPHPSFHSQSQQVNRKNNQQNYTRTTSSNWKLTTVTNGHLLSRTVTPICLLWFDQPNNGHAFQNLAKYHMPLIQPRCLPTHQTSLLCQDSKPRNTNNINLILPDK